jgi:hypothetical protein
MKSYIQMDWRPPSSCVPGGLQLRLNMKNKTSVRISIVYFGHFKGIHADSDSDSLLDGPKKNQSAQIAVSDSAVSVQRPQSH